MAKLTPKQERFVREYLIDLNATQAAIRAGYSRKTANEIGYENLRKTEVQEAINSAMQERARRTEITADRVLRQLARLGFYDIRKAFTEDGRLKPIHEIDDDTAAAIASIEVQELWEGRGGDREHIGRLHKVKFADMKGSVELLMRHLGLFKDKLEHTVKDGGSADLSDVKAALLRGVQITSGS
jgi:phage terminase small subunit